MLQKKTSNIVLSNISEKELRDTVIVGINL